jgi:ankyrin repeat protein/transglutaminase-like putative cysteine protease
MLVLFLLAAPAFASPSRDLKNGIYKNDLQKVKQTLADGADVNAVTHEHNQNTALIYACLKGHSEIALYLIERGADVKRINKQGKSALLYASQYGLEKVVKRLLEKGAPMNTPDNFGYTPIYIAIMKNQYRVFRHFKDHGLDFNAKLIRGRWTPLQYAIMKKSNESVKELLRLGVKLDDSGDKTPALHKAILENNLGLVKILVEKGSNPELADFWGRDAFDIASLNERKEILLYLAKRAGYGKSVIQDIEKGDFYYGGRKKGLIVWFYGFETEEGKYSGTLREFSGSIVSPTRAQNVRKMDGLSSRSGVEKDKNGNIYFKYDSLPVTVNADQPFYGGYILDMTRYKSSLKPADSFPPVSLRNRNFPPEVKKYLADEKDFLINHSKVKRTARKLLSGAKSYREIFANVDRFVHKQLKYGDPAKRPNTAVDILGFSRGRCGEYTKLKMALLRSAGVPTRKVFGTASYDFGPVHLEKKETINDHVWLESYIPGEGWVQIPSTSKFGEKVQFQETYKGNYIIRRRGEESQYSRKQKTGGLSRTGNFHGHGVFLEMDSSHFESFSRVLKKALTYDQAVSENIFSEMQSLPADAQVVVNWFLVSRAQREIHQKAAKNFLALAAKSEKLKKNNFIYVSSKVMKKRIKQAELSIGSVNPAKEGKGNAFALKNPVIPVPGKPLAADRVSAKYQTGEIDPAVKRVPNSIQKGVVRSPKTYLKRLVNYLTRNAPNDFLKVKRIHDWITLHIPYDKDRDYSSPDDSDDPYDVLKQLRTTCGGYAKLFKEMAEIAGVKNHIVYGYSKFYGKRDGRLGTHSWNSVEIGGKGYIVDVTGDVRGSYEDGKKPGALRKYKDENLFINPEVKIRIHFPMEEKFQYLKDPISLDEFKQMPQTHLSFYIHGLSFADREYLSRVEKNITPREGWAWEAIYDRVVSNDDVIKIRLNVPANYQVRAHLRDESGERFSSHAETYIKNGQTVAVFAAPKQGVFNASISVKPKGKTSWAYVYHFEILEISGTGSEE